MARRVARRAARKAARKAARRRRISQPVLRCDCAIVLVRHGAAVLLSSGRTIESLFAELVTHAILQRCPKRKLTE